MSTLYLLVTLFLLLATAWYFLRWIVSLIGRNGRALRFFLFCLVSFGAAVAFANLYSNGLTPEEKAALAENNNGVHTADTEKKSEETEKKHAKKQIHIDSSANKPTETQATVSQNRVRIPINSPIGSPEVSYFYIGEINEKGLPNGQGTIVYKGRAEQEILLFFGEFKDGVIDGKGTEFDENQEIVRSGIYKDNKFIEHPFENEFYISAQSGKIYFHGEQSKTKTGKTMKVFFPGGNIFYEGGWANNSQNGRGKTYYPNERVQKEATFENGVLGEGPYKEYHKNGKLAVEGKSKKGFWDEEASLYGDATFFDEKETLRYKGEVNKGRYHGEGILYNESGQKVYEGHFEKGDRDGSGTSFYSTGKVQYKGEFKDDTYHGSGTLYNESGNVVQKGKWEKGTFVK